jgi:hypothetical protein
VPEDQLRTTKKLCVPHRLGALEYSSGRSVIGQFHYVLQGRAATTATRRSAGSSTSPRSPPTCSTAPASGRRVMQRGRDCIRGPRLRWIGLSPSSRRKCESSRCTDDDSGWRGYGYVGTAAQIQQIFFLNVTNNQIMSIMNKRAAVFGEPYARQPHPVEISPFQAIDMYPFAVLSLEHSGGGARWLATVGRNARTQQHRRARR